MFDSTRAEHQVANPRGHKRIFDGDDDTVNISPQGWVSH